MVLTLSSPGPARDRLFNVVKKVFKNLSYSHTMRDYGANSIQFSLDEKLSEMRITEGTYDAVAIVEIIGSDEFKNFIYTFIEKGLWTAYSNSKPSTLLMSVSWGRTSEGASYWSSIHAKLSSAGY